jgi:hypothetical protein
MHGDALTAIRALAEVEYKIHSRPGAFVKLEPEMDGWMFPSVPLQMTNFRDLIANSAGRGRRTTNARLTI